MTKIKQDYERFCQDLEQIDTMAEGERPEQSWQTVKAYRNAYRVGCSQRIAERIWLARQERKQPPAAHVNDEADECPHSRIETTASGETCCQDCGLYDPTPTPPVGTRTSMALAIIERDQDEVDAEYKSYSKGWGTVSSVGQTSSRSGYDAGRAAADRVKLGGGGKGLPAGRGRLKKGKP